MFHKVFVYGTLKTGEPNHYWLTNPQNGSSKFIGVGKTKIKYPLVIATKYNIPFLLYRPGTGNYVAGEIYEVDDKMLSKLDILEDHPNFYVREFNDILLKNGSCDDKVQCWVYFLKSFKPELLERQHFENYSSSGDHGLVYLERSKRDSDYDHQAEIKP